MKMKGSNFDLTSMYSRFIKLYSFYFNFKKVAYILCI